MTEKKKSRLVKLTIAVLAAAVLAWFAITCAAKPETRIAISEIFHPTPAATPLPALPAGEMAEPTSAGDPPVGVFTDEQIAQFDQLPVGAGTPPTHHTPAPVEQQ